MKHTRHLGARAACALAPLLLPLLAQAVPLSRAEIVSLCGDAEDQAQCGHLVEERQIRAVAKFVERDGNELRVRLVPYGISVYQDIDSALGGATTYAVWDYLASLDTLVLFTTRGERTGFLLLERRGGEEHRLPSEPVMAPDQRHFATADVCARDCDNEVAVWRVGRDGIRKEVTWTPPPGWSDVTVAWRGASTIELDYTAAGEAQSRTVERRLDDPSWKKAGAR